MQIKKKIGVGINKKNYKLCLGNFSWFSWALSWLNLVTKLKKKIKKKEKKRKNVQIKKNVFVLLFFKRWLKCMQELPTLHRNYSSGVII